MKIKTNKQIKHSDPRDIHFQNVVANVTENNTQNVPLSYWLT